MPVVVLQPSGHTSIAQSQHGPNSHLCISITTFFINPLFGLVAVVFAILSKLQYSADWESARVKGKIAFFISITGIILSVSAGIIVILIFFTKDT